MNCLLLFSINFLGLSPTAVGFDPAKRAEELRRALARGHPVDVEELKFLEVKARMLKDSYHTSVVTILSKLREEKEGADNRLRRVGRTMIRTLHHTGAPTSPILSPLPCL